MAAQGFSGSEAAHVQLKMLRRLYRTMDVEQAMHPGRPYQVVAHDGQGGVGLGAGRGDEVDARGRLEADVRLPVRHTAQRHDTVAGTVQYACRIRQVRTGCCGVAEARPHSAATVTLTPGGAATGQRGLGVRARKASPSWDRTGSVSMTA
jgi:hypothetical protein